MSATTPRTWCPTCGLPGNHAADWAVCVQQLRRTAELLEKANRQKPDVIPRRRAAITHPAVLEPEERKVS